MAQLVDSRGYNLNPQLGGFGKGVLPLAQLEQFGQQNIAQGKREQIKSILSQQQGQPTGQPSFQTDPATGQVIPQAETQQPLTLEQKKQMAREIDPIEAERMFKVTGIDSASQRADASRFASQLETTPFAQRSGLINARVQKLQSEGRDAKDTIELLSMDEKTQNQAALGIQLADLSTKERLGLKAKQSALAAKRVEAKDVKSSKILDNGTVITVLKNNETTVTGPDGTELEGDARVQAIRDAQEFGVDVQQRRAKGREKGKGAGKIAITSFETAGRIRENISDLKRGIDLIEKEGAQTGYISDFLPNMRAATRKFANLRRKLGLNVVASVTFGALSEGELNLAMDVAMPKGMSEEETVRWIKDRVEAQEKLASNLEGAALYLADHSVAELIQRNRAMKKAAQKKERKAVEKPEAPAAPQAGGIKFLGFE